MIARIRRGATGLEWPLVLALLLTIIAAWPLLASPGLIETRAGGDSPFLLQRTQQLVMALRQGVFPVRWMGDAAYGMGYPFFNFYASLPYYFAALLKLLGFTYVSAIKATQVLGLVAAGLGAYLLSKRLWRNSWGAALASAAYTFAPFHLVNLYVRGDSLSEFWAFAFYPFILLTLLRAWEEPTLPRLSALALALGGLFVTHNVSALIFAPFVGLFLVYLLLRPQEKRLRRFLISVSGLGLGLAVSAWFWLPALLERSLVHLEVQTTGYFFYGGHFRAANLVQTSPLFNYAVDSAGTPFAMGLIRVLVTAAALGWVLYSWVRRKRVDGTEAWAVAFLLLATWLITPLSRFAWAHVPLLPYAQFPWRFLSVQALAAALVVGRLGSVGQAQVASAPSGGLEERRVVWLKSRWIAEALVVVIAVSVVTSIRPTYLYVSDADINAQRLTLYEAFTGNVGSTVRAEYLPEPTSPRPYVGESLWTDGEPLPRAVSGELGNATILEKQTSSQRWAVNVLSADARLVFQTLYYPGWRCFVDGRETACGAQPGWGAIALTVPQGSHEVTLSFGSTGRRLATEVVSLIALLVCLAFAFVGQGALTRIGKAVGACALVLAVFAVSGAASSALSPTYATDDLTMDWAAGPYLGHNPGGLPYEGGARLLGYTLSSSDAAPGDTVTVALQWNAAADGLKAQVSLQSMAAPLFQVPDVLVTSESSVSGGISGHTLTVPATLPPGAYLLGVTLTKGERELHPLDENGQPQGQTYLQPVTVTGSAKLPEGASLDLPLGDDVLLRDVEVTQSQPGQLEAALNWTTARQLDQNYAVSVRLLDASGQTLAQQDSQPNYGFSPTGLWQPDEPVWDRHWLDLPPGLPIDEDYTLQIVLYDPNTLAAVGMAAVPGIRLSMVKMPDVIPIVAPIGPGWALSALSVEKSEAWQGEQVVIRATWAALVETTQAYTVHVELRDPAGDVVWESAAPLNAGPLAANALVSQRYLVDVPLQVPGGAYSLAFTIEDASGQTIGSYVCPTPLIVRERRRTFSTPGAATRANIYFGEEIALLGYDLRRDGQTLHVTLYWQAQARPAADRTVFVHLFAAATETIVAQWDSPPQAGQYPTTQWAPGEVVTDEAALDLSQVPPGSYRLAIGLYGPGDAPRLAARQSDGARLVNDRYVPADEIAVP